jgi:hypothetical protein
MRFVEFNSLLETSRGVLFRSVGDIFTSLQDPSKTLTFAGSQLFPSPKGAFPDALAFQQAIKSAEKKFPGIQWTNSPTSATLAFAVIILEDPATKKKVYFGRYFKEILPDMAGKWLNNGIPGYALGIKSSSKARSGLKPNDLLPIQQFKNPAAVIAALKEGLDPAIIEGLKMITAGKLPYFKVSPDLEAAIRDDLGEIIAPMCLWQGMIGAEAEAARAFLLKKTTWNACSISFSAAKNSGLVDSIIRPPRGIAVGISSKGASGAKASVSNIWSGVELLRSNGQGDVVAKYPEAVKVLEIIQDSSTIGGPINLGIMFGLCSQQDGALINDAIKQGIRQVPKNPKYKNIVALMNAIASKGMEKSNYNIGYHALAGLAKLVADRVNTQTKNFSEACITFLNSSPLLQIHLYTKADKNGIAVTNFKTIWPPQFKGNVSLNAGKTYYTTGYSSKFSFGF